MNRKFQESLNKLEQEGILFYIQDIEKTLVVTQLRKVAVLQNGEITEIEKTNREGRRISEDVRMQIAELQALIQSENIEMEDCELV